MRDKEKYIEFTKENLTGKAQEITINQINLFYDDSVKINKTKYNTGDDVKLKKGTLLHGLGGNPNAFDYVLENGIISRNFNGEKNNKINYSVGVWNIKEDCFLKDYIHLYSGVTVCYYMGRGPLAKEEYTMIGFNQVEQKLIELNNNKDIWTWYAEQTKEVRFMPCLCSNKVQYAFIFNMESNYAKKMLYVDTWNFNLGKEVCKQFYSEKFFEEIWDKPLTPITTNRESSIIFGLPLRLIEGVIVGRLVENDKEKLKHIKSKLPDCYICNVDGKVIVSN